jgi:hypothetical protein
MYIERPELDSSVVRGDTFASDPGASLNDAGIPCTCVFGSGITVRGILLLLQVFPFAISYVSTIDDQHGFYG